MSYTEGLTFLSSVPRSSTDITLFTIDDVLYRYNIVQEGTIIRVKDHDAVVTLGLMSPRDSIIESQALTSHY